MPISPEDDQWMARALQLAEKGRYTAWPNPCVGCVLVREGQVIGEGWHYRAGEAHAEIMALANADQTVAGATAYVTLEPCNHTGKTGPCTEALIDAGIQRIVYGMVDPNSQVAGTGLARLRAAGIVVEGPVLEVQARALNPGFIFRMEKQRPYVRCKMAISLDGRTAMASGESQWITGPEARQDVQRWRARSSAVVTGIGSVLQDNSRLTLREDELALSNCDDVLKRPPLRVVLDSQLRIGDDAAVLAGDSPTLVVAATVEEELDADRLGALRTLSGVDVICVHADDAGRVCLKEALHCLAMDFECNEILLEAGAQLVGSFFQQGLIDEWIIYQAPVFLGAHAKPLMEWSIDKMAEKHTLEILDQRKFGQDTRIIAKARH